MAILVGVVAKSNVETLSNPGEGYFKCNVVAWARRCHPGGKVG